MQLDVTPAMSSPGVVFNFSIEGHLSDLEFGGMKIDSAYPIILTGTYRFSENIVVLCGKLDTTLGYICSRCLSSFEKKLQIIFNEEFSKTIDEEHPDRFIFDDSNMLQLQEMVETLVYLNISMKPLCSEACKGINFSQCNVDDAQNLKKDVRFEKLRSLFKQNEEE